ncbi:hypothetical protein POPTR_018G031250v4 [Populus trichocarpa]|uniref:Uncharacterized protein n=1 Tax=Populus trichocarpa TaxID=3694 RepID=A0ACC0RLA9_POPTR|nr:hypothetical protein POPTR_018G031250v4 [Populus trichocarpa]
MRTAVPQDLRPEHGRPHEDDQGIDESEIEAPLCLHPRGFWSFGLRALRIYGGSLLIFVKFLPSVFEEW